MDGKYAGCEIEEGVMALFASPRVLGFGARMGRAQVKMSATCIPAGLYLPMNHLHTATMWWSMIIPM